MKERKIDVMFNVETTQIHNRTQQTGYSFTREGTLHFERHDGIFYEPYIRIRLECTWGRTFTARSNTKYIIGGENLNSQFFATIKDNTMTGEIYISIFETNPEEQFSKSEVVKFNFSFPIDDKFSKQILT